MGLELYDKDPMSLRLSGLPLEYRILKSLAAIKGNAQPRLVSTLGKEHKK